MKNNIFSELKSAYNFLTKTEKRLADYILANPSEFIELSTSRLSELANVSQGSINNFSKKFCSGGFSSLKLKVASCISSNKGNFDNLNEKDNIKNLLKMKIRENAVALRNTLEINNEETLKNVVNKIMTAKKIEIYGIFHSGIAAKDFCFQLIQLGFPATFVEDMLISAVSASMLDENCLLIAISSTGKTREILDAVEIAKENNVPIVSITCNKFSPLAKLSDYVLLTASSGIIPEEASNEIRHSQLFLTDAICSHIKTITDTANKELYTRLRKIINSHSVTD